MAWLPMGDHIIMAYRRYSYIDGGGGTFGSGSPGLGAAGTARPAARDSDERKTRTGVRVRGVASARRREPPFALMSAQIATEFFEFWAQPGYCSPGTDQKLSATRSREWNYQSFSIDWHSAHPKSAFLR